MLKCVVLEFTKITTCTVNAIRKKQRSHGWNVLQ